MTINDAGLDVQFEAAKQKGILIDTWFLESTKIATHEIFEMPKSALTRQVILDLIGRVASLGSGFTAFLIADISLSIETAPNTYLNRSLGEIKEASHEAMAAMVAAQNIHKINGISILADHDVFCFDKNRKLCSRLFENSLMFQFHFTYDRTRRFSPKVSCTLHLYSDTYSVTHQDNDYTIMMIQLFKMGLLGIGTANINRTAEELRTEFGDLFRGTSTSGTRLTLDTLNFERYENCEIVLDENGIIPLEGNRQLHEANKDTYQSMLNKIKTFSL